MVVAQQLVGPARVADPLRTRALVSRRLIWKSRSLANAWVRLRVRHDS